MLGPNAGLVGQSPGVGLLGVGQGGLGKLLAYTNFPFADSNSAIPNTEIGNKAFATSPGTVAGIASNKAKIVIYGGGTLHGAFIDVLGYNHSVKFQVGSTSDTWFFDRLTDVNNVAGDGLFIVHNGGNSRVLGNFWAIRFHRRRNLNRYLRTHLCRAKFFH